MNALFGFTIGGLMMVAVVMVIALSVIGSFTSASSEKSMIKEVNSALNLDNPKMCLNFDNPTQCVSTFAYMKRTPQMCMSFLEDESNQFECLSKFFRKYQERVCDYVSEDFVESCLIEAQKWKN
ncbi:MAG: hypothetical protein ACE5DU_03845 [Nitrosopumilus sp.]